MISIIICVGVVSAYISDTWINVFLGLLHGVILKVVLSAYVVVVQFNIIECID